MQTRQTIEQAFCAYKSKQTPKMPKCRYYVDNGSLLFNQIVRNVSVLAPRHQALVGRGVREASLASMTGIPHNEDQAEQDREIRLMESTEADGSSVLNQPASEESAAQENKALVAAVVKRRKLYKQLSGTELP